MKTEIQIISNNLENFLAGSKVQVESIIKAKVGFEQKRQCLERCRANLTGALAPFEYVESFLDIRTRIIEFSGEITTLIHELLMKEYEAK